MLRTDCFVYICRLIELELARDITTCEFYKNLVFHNSLDRMDKAETYNKDELNAPEWMNVEFFEKILSETEKDESIKVSA